MKASGVRAILVLIFRRIAAIYFRQIEIGGALPARTTTGRLFAANHVNGLVDPILVLTQAPCPISPVAKSTLWKIPGLTWLLAAVDAVPIVRRRDDPNKSAKDNDAVFGRVAEHIAAGGNILIFPEGTSHNEPHLLALRSGAGRMLALAGGKATFQAVALEFDARDVFRSRALLVFGPVRDVGDLTAAQITSHLQQDLSELLVEGATWEERVLVVRVADMFGSNAHDDSLAMRNRTGRRIEEARRALSAADPTAVQALERRLAQYFARLEDLGLRDVDVVHRAAASQDLATAAMVLTLPLAFVGALLWYVPYQVPRFVTKRLQGDPDVSSTYKLGVGLLVHPSWAAVLAAIGFACLSPGFAVLWALVAVASPFAALPWIDRWDRLESTLSRMGPLESRRDQLADVAAERAAIMRELDGIRLRIFGD